MRASAALFPPCRLCLCKFFGAINSAKDQQPKLTEKIGINLRRNWDLAANDAMLAFLPQVPRRNPSIETTIPVGFLVVRSHDDNRVLVDQGGLEHRIECIGIDILNDRRLHARRGRWP